MQEITRILPSFAASECANYFANAGYVQSEMITLLSWLAARRYLNMELLKDKQIGAVTPEPSLGGRSKCERPASLGAVGVRWFAPPTTGRSTNS